ncbi:VOC family protein [Sporosarcina sp. Te-1]|uniref:VOC family protein n=1 Tax=Sporosarcina sp. Te-1 TaxID=2818390 RepID=UPI001A9E3D08|nr:VOC family protein [Sporosarcina sp. Te-1]QTD42511.1 VOC family protein [Sporosarcina sp. Te-1]
MFKIGGIFIPVTNVEKSAEWYEKNLGVKKIDSWEDGVGYYLPIGSTQLALVKVDSPQPTEFSIKGNQKNSYYNFVVDDIENALKHLKHNGVVTTEIEDIGGMKFFDFFDLDGNPFSVVNEVESSPFHSDNVKKMQVGS